jgi:hypothetical protein
LPELNSSLVDGESPHMSPYRGFFSTYDKIVIKKLYFLLIDGIFKSSTRQTKKANIMSIYESRITEQDGSFYALIVRIDCDGEESVIHGYKGRFFSTRKGAEKSTSKYIAKNK